MYHDKPRSEYSKTKLELGTSRTETVLRRCMIHPADSAKYLIGTRDQQNRNCTAKMHDTSCRQRTIIECTSGRKRHAFSHCISPKLRLNLILGFYSARYIATLILILTAQQNRDSSVALVAKNCVLYGLLRNG
jgi:hypothetical protein